MFRAWVLWPTVLVLLGAMLAASLFGNTEQGAFAGQPTPTPKPNGLGSLTGVYDALLHDGPETTSYNCIFRLDHDNVSNEAKAAAQCYADTPGLSPGSPLVDPADGVPGPPPPPPYTTHRPAKLTGSYHSGTDSLSLVGCFRNVGGSIAPNVILQLTIPNAGASLPNLMGVALVYNNQSVTACAAGAPSGPFSAQAINLTRVSSARDFDSDGCTDRQELEKTEPISSCGDDPYNPHDSDLDFNGPFSSVASFIYADWNVSQSALLPGVYFFCIGNAGHNIGTNDLEARAQCYSSSPDLARLDRSAVPWRDVGLPGAPPPPPFSGNAPIALSGGVSPSGTVTMLGCLPNVGGVIGPNTMLETSFDVRTGSGWAGVYFNQTSSDCDADPPTPQGIPDAFFLMEVAQQDVAWDADGDGCTDAEELAIGGPIAGCGADPFNPFDSDADANGISHLTMTVDRADWDDLSSQILPGSYYNCAVSTVHSLGNNQLTSRVYCYIDAATLTLNCQATTGSPAAPCAMAASTCPPAAAIWCGDGVRAAPPPRIDDDVAPPDRSLFGDVDGGHTVLTGGYNPTTRSIDLSGCIQSVENATLGPSIYVELIFDVNTGVGAGSIYTQEQLVDCLAGTPQGAGQDASVTWAEQGPNYDTDRDKCSDARELSDSPTTGGLRDPFNFWDVRSVPVGVPAVSDRAVSVSDVVAVVARFGSHDAGATTIVSRYSHPVVTTVGPAPSYHPAFDTAGGLVGSSGGWNLKGPDGAVAVGDVLAIVSQFGMNCA
ncbi:MAG: flexitail domain-containing putative surface protein [Dehalococcoidia bacterium]